MVHRVARQQAQCIPTVIPAPPRTRPQQWRRIEQIASTPTISRDNPPPRGWKPGHQVYWQEARSAAPTATACVCAAVSRYPQRGLWTSATSSAASDSSTQGNPRVIMPLHIVGPRLEAPRPGQMSRCRLALIGLVRSHFSTGPPPRQCARRLPLPWRGPTGW